MITGDFLKKPQGSVLLIPVFEAHSKSNGIFNKVDQILGGRLSKKAKHLRFKFKKDEIFVLHETEKIHYDSVVVFGVGEKQKLTLPFFQEALSNGIRSTVELKYESAALILDDISTKSSFDLGRTISQSFYLSQYTFLKYKNEEDKEKKMLISELYIYKDEDHEFRAGLKMGEIVSEGVLLTRDLVNEPAINTHPDDLVRVAENIAKESRGKIEVNVLSDKDCRNLGMGAYLAVAQGSNMKPKFIILHYKGSGSRSTSKKVCLIGKSITFDSGGLSLKPSKSMETMKIDMAGGATVLGVFKILARKECKSEVYGILPACENMPSGSAIRPGDIVRALNGKTIEILNTDAEGRLVLADALSYAEKYLRPDYIIDLATLTGAIIVGLGPDIAGLFGNNQDLIEKIKEAASSQGEPVWAMPQFKKYLKKMKSEVADLKNVSGSGYGGGAITASLFLEEFVEKTPWVHLDIAGASYNEDAPQGITPKGATGFGVLTLIELLLTN
ncbi:hypothetical protein A3C23_01155 [Candidatus Roizmanbacteria bacterium RIFCSPHIGHO2_02_FULL_37_13b]|nr:MAG: hypothetical protein A3C23_01155 [Candidatus Roizmanbacteria bacterium RIFCSPHIGHO2_02_FULL_37_13b]